MLLEGKTVLVTGVLTERSIAWATAREAQGAGATVLLTGHGRSRRLTERAAGSLPHACPVLELDVTREEDFAALPGAVREHCDSLEGAVHAVAWAGGALGRGLLAGEGVEVARMVEISALSYRRLAEAVVPLMQPGGSLVGLTFSPGVAWPGYDWMGVGKAALEAVNRGLAAHLGPLGIRTNLVAGGPITSVASEGFERFEVLCRAWEAQAPLGWRSDDATGVARAVCALLSDWTAALTGGIVHADGGYHAVARPAAESFGAREPASFPARERGA